jgi:hypothetical protein
MQCNKYVECKNLKKKNTEVSRACELNSVHLQIMQKLKGKQGENLKRSGYIFVLKSTILIDITLTQL